MTGRGKDASMYGRDAFIDEVVTLDGGIDYAYYHYLRWHLLRDEIGDYPLADEHRGRSARAATPSRAGATPIE